MATRDEIDLKERAERALKRGKPAEALPLYRALLRAVKEPQAAVYDSWLEGLLSVYRSLGRTREAGFALLGLRRFAEAERCFDPARDPSAWALCAAKRAGRRAAAEVLARAGHTGLAAIELESIEDFPAAREHWLRTLSSPRLAERPYESALVWFNLGRVVRRLGDAVAARRAFGEAQERLERLSDEFERRGERERAFECFGVLIEMGREAEAFENVAEGYVNAIRLLSADGARFRIHVLQHYEDFIAFASEHGELHSAAQLAREAADFCARLELAYERHYRQRVVTLGREAARHATAVAAPVELAEGGLVLALDAAAALGEVVTCAAIYAELAALALSERKRARYAALAERFRLSSPGAAPPPTLELPEALRRRRAHEPVWRDDVIEWELDGDVTAVLARVAALRVDYLARAALRALLLAADPGVAEDTGAVADLALALGEAMVYEVLRPLERMYDEARPGAPGSGRVRAAAMGALQTLYFRRSFTLLRRGLSDADQGVRQAALRAVRALRFQQAVDLQVRIYHEHPDPTVRLAALEAVADVGSLEAGLFLLEVVRREQGPVFERALERLKRLPGHELLPTVRHHAERERGPLKAALESVVREMSGGAG